MRNSITKNETLQLKGIAICLMVFHHCFLDPTRYFGKTVAFWPFSENQINQIAAFFKICVGMYVFLSAYGMTKATTKFDRQGANSWCLYLNHRLINLLSGYWFVFISSGIVALLINPQRFVAVYGIRKIDAFIFYALDFMGLANLSNTPTFNGTWWYISLAIVIIIIFPVLIKLYKFIGNYMILFMMLVPISLNFSMHSTIPELARWGGALAFGICMANSEKWTHWRLCKNKLIEFLILFMGCIACFFIRRSSSASKLIWLWDSIIPVYIIYFLWRYILNHLLSKMFTFLGKHSMNIFLVHTFIRAIWGNSWTYSFKWFLLIAFMLLINSLIVSIILEYIKQKIHWEQVLQYLIVRLSINSI